MIKFHVQARTIAGDTLHVFWHDINGCRPRRHPDLERLVTTSHWDSVLVVGIPYQSSEPAAATSSAAGSSHGRATNSVDAGQNGSEASSAAPVPSDGSSASLPDSGSSQHDWTLSEGDAEEAESVLTLGLRGHTHDLERCVNQSYSAMYRHGDAGLGT